ncbi:U3 small nucleolar RNA-associated protein 13 [Sorochytrium milnesiophthora]
MASGKLKIKSRHVCSFKLVDSIASVYTGGSIALTSDYEHLISTVGEDILVTRLSNGQVAHRLKGDTSAVTCFAVKPNDQHLVSASEGQQLTLWDLATGAAVRQWKAHEAAVLVMDYDATSTLVATGSADSTIKVWDTDNGYCTHNFKGHRGVVSAVRFHPEKRRLQLFSGGQDGTVRVWDLTKRSCIAVLENHMSVVRGLAVSAAGHLLSAGRDKIITVWDLNKHKALKTVPVYESLESLICLPGDATVPGKDDNTVSSSLCLVGGESGIVKVYDYETGSYVHELREPSVKYQISSLLYNAAHRVSCTVTTDQNILFYDIDDSFRRIKQVIGHNDEVIDLCYIGPDESHIAVATNSEQIRIFKVGGYDGRIVHGHADVVFCLDKSNDGTLLVTGSKDNTARVWRFAYDAENDKHTCECVATLAGHNESIGAVALSRRSTSFVLTGSQDRTVKCWDIGTLSSAHTEENMLKPKSRYTIKTHDKDINSLSVAPNDRIFATGSQDKTAKVWNVADGKLLGVCKGHKRGVWCTQFSPVDQVLATSSGDRTIKIWNLSDFSCIKTFEGHTNSVLKFSFITSGTQIVSCGSDGLVKLWTIKTNECVTTMDNHTDKVWALTVRKDENMVLSGGADSMISMWQDHTIEEEEEALRQDEERLVKEQDLSNYLAMKDYKNAILLAMSLEQPYRLLRIFEDVQKYTKDVDSITGSAAVDAVLGSFAPDEVERLLKFVRDWNTNSRHSRVAQTVLNVFLRAFSPEQLLKLKTLKEIVNAMIPYTQRHFARVDGLVTKSYILDYTLQAMDILTPNLEDGAAAEDVSGGDEDGHHHGQANGKRKLTNGDADSAAH